MKTALSVLAAVLIFVSCKKEDERKDIISMMDSRLHVFKYKKGSFWVYQNDSSAVTDTITVTGTDSGFCWSPPPVHGSQGVKKDFYTVKLKSSVTSGGFNYYLNSVGIRMNGGGSFCELGQFIYSVTGHGGDGLTTLDTLSSLTVNGHTFTHVTKVKITASEQYQHVFDTDTYLYFTDSIGLIRKEIETTSGIETWSIKTWNIIR